MIPRPLNRKQHFVPMEGILVCTTSQVRCYGITKKGKRAMLPEAPTNEATEKNSTEAPGQMNKP